MRRLAALLLVALLAGCFGGREDTSGLAKPTDTPVVPPTPTPSTTTGGLPPNFDDPGYVTNATWHVGDAWDYVSGAGNFHTVRVVANATVDGSLFFVTHETEGRVGQPASLGYRRWINASSWAATNLSVDRSTSVSTFTPGAPQRVLRNSSYRYNASIGGEKHAVYANVRYAARFNQSLPWGESVQVGRFEHRILDVHGTSQDRILTIRIFSRDYGNDVSYQLADGAETFNLVAVRYGSLTHGNLMDG